MFIQLYYRFMVQSFFIILILNNTQCKLNFNQLLGHENNLKEFVNLPNLNEYKVKNNLEKYLNQNKSNIRCFDLNDFCLVIDCFETNKNFKKQIINYFGNLIICFNNFDKSLIDKINKFYFNNNFIKENVSNKIKNIFLKYDISIDNFNLIFQNISLPIDDKIGFYKFIDFFEDEIKLICLKFKFDVTKNNSTNFKKLFLKNQHAYRTNIYEELKYLQCFHKNGIEKQFKNSKKYELEKQFKNSETFELEKNNRKSKTFVLEKHINNNKVNDLEKKFKNKNLFTNNSFSNLFHNQFIKFNLVKNFNDLYNLIEKFINYEKNFNLQKLDDNRNEDINQKEKKKKIQQNKEKPNELKQNEENKKKKIEKKQNEKNKKQNDNEQRNNKQDFKNNKNENLRENFELNDLRRISKKSIDDNINSQINSKYFLNSTNYIKFNFFGNNSDLFEYFKLNCVLIKKFLTCSGENVTYVPLINNIIVEEITLKSTGIQTIKSSFFSSYKKNLKKLSFAVAKKLENIEESAFEELINLQSLVIKQAPLLKNINPNVFLKCPSQFSLQIYQSGLENALSLKHDKEKTIDFVFLDNNKIQALKSKTFDINVISMSIDYNSIEIIEDNAFEGFLINLSLKGNRKLTKISNLAFNKLNDLRTLDLSYTSITSLPTYGLENLEVLRLRETYSLKVFPSTLQLPSIKEAYLTYSHHCCAFEFPKRQDPDGYEKLNNQFSQFCDDKPSTTTLPGDLQSHNYTENSKSLIKKDFRPKFNTSNNNNFDETIPKMMIKLCGKIFTENVNIVCSPKPDAFNPCEDIMGNIWLRIAVWFVLTAALFGNICVIVVLSVGRSNISVSKFLMCNLAFADFLMGVYLFILASFDLKSKGSYFNYALDWQHGLGCKVAGFLSVFASESSIFTLTIITLERLFKITQAIYLRRRLELTLATKIMICGWIYSFIMATLPLPYFNISSYSKTSICLPMEINGKKDFFYILFILCLKIIDFLFICICYIIMYLSVISQKARSTSSDLKIAKKMGLLIIVDFACWIPIAFFGLTAIIGYPLIDVTKSKILLVFFFPLNSMANPFLYAILTDNFSKDFNSLAKRIGIFKHNSTYINHHYQNNPNFCSYNRKNIARRQNNLVMTNFDNCFTNLPGYSDCDCTTSNSCSASSKRFSYSFCKESLKNNSSSEHPKVLIKSHKVQRYNYRNPHPHHHFETSRQIKDYHLVKPDVYCNKHKHKSNCKNNKFHHHEHPHSTPASQVYESNSSEIKVDSDSMDKKDKKKSSKHKKFFINALSTPALNTNAFSSSSSSDYFNQKNRFNDFNQKNMKDFSNKNFFSRDKLKQKLSSVKTNLIFRQNLSEKNCVEKNAKNFDLGILTTGKNQTENKMNDFDETYEIPISVLNNVTKNSHRESNDNFLKKKCKNAMKKVDENIDYTNEIMNQNFTDYLDPIDLREKISNKNKPITQTEFELKKLKSKNKLNDDSSSEKDLKEDKLEENLFEDENSNTKIDIQLSKESLSIKSNHSKLDDKVIQLDDFKNQLNFKDQILKKWLRRKKKLYNCHTNFKKIKSDNDSLKDSSKYNV